jgi:hypothetical protein
MVILNMSKTSKLPYLLIFSVLDKIFTSLFKSVSVEFGSTGSCDRIFDFIGVPKIEISTDILSEMFHYSFAYLLYFQELSILEIRLLLHMVHHHVPGTNVHQSQL